MLSIALARVERNLLQINRKISPPGRERWFRGGRSAESSFDTKFNNLM